MDDDFKAKLLQGGKLTDDEIRSLREDKGQLMVLPSGMEYSHVEVLRLQPNDKLVVTVDQPLTAAQVQSIQSALKPEFPDNKVLIFSGGMKLTVIRADESIIVED